MVRPFAKTAGADVGGNQGQFLQPKNIRRDLSLPQESNIIASEEAWYALRIDECLYKETRKSGDMFKAVHTVIAGDGPNAPGSVADYTVMKNTDGFDRDVKTYVCTAMNYDPAKIVESDFENVVSRAQPITSSKRYIKVRVYNVKTKSGKDFTKHVWSPLEATFGPDGTLAGLNPPAVDVVAEYVRTKGEIK